MLRATNIGPHIAVYVGLGAIGALGMMTRDGGFLLGISNTGEALADPFLSVPALVIGLIVRSPLALAPILFLLGWMIGAIYTSFYHGMWPGPAILHLTGQVAAAFLAGYMTNGIRAVLLDGN